MGFGHVPVLLEACVRVLRPRAGDVYVDCTAGLGGHAAAVGPLVVPGGTVVLNDADPLNMVVAAERVRTLAQGARVEVLTGNFAEVPHKLDGLGGVRADVVLADLGFASTQVDDARRGFSFSQDGPLDMRMDPTLAVTAADLVNGLPEAELAGIIERYGEDRSARRIAAKLAWARAERPIETTGRLAELVRSAAGGRARSEIDPATRTFQALRIAVNDEIGSLEALLEAAIADAERAANKQPTAWLKPGARFAVISFHSLEDRPVKRAMERLVKLGAEDLTDGAVTATEEEISNNPRARSAKLRAVKIPG
jgi:16S rRNA (cytosine1402-N4)-methyltransferase